MNTLHRQGDVGFLKIEELPLKLKKKKDNVIVYGEVTGHAHRLIDGSIHKDDDGQMYLITKDTAHVVHEEHNTVKLEKGYWKILRQREYTSQDMTRLVID